RGKLVTGVQTCALPICAIRSWRLGELAAGTLHADGEALRIALDALLENAVKYTEPADAITLSARALDGGLLVQVADEGQGLPARSEERRVGKEWRGGGA